MFGKKKTPAPAPATDEDTEAPVEVDEGSSVELKKAELAPKGGKAGGGLLGFIIAAVAVTAVAAGGGTFLGQKTAAAIETAIALKDAASAKPAEGGHPVSVKYSGDMVLKPIEAVVTNLADPSETWIRLETAMVFKNGALENPEITAGEIRQDILAYLRTVSLGRLEGPSALQHLRDDLNERASIRSGGRVNEIILQTLVIQ